MFKDLRVLPTCAKIYLFAVLLVPISLGGILFYQLAMAASPFVPIAGMPAIPMSGNHEPYNYPVLITDGIGHYLTIDPVTGGIVTSSTVATEVYDTFETQVVLLASNAVTTITPSMPAATQRGFVLGNQSNINSFTYKINNTATATSFLIPPSAMISLSPCKVTTLSARGYGATATLEVQFFGKL